MRYLRTRTTIPGKLGENLRANVDAARASRVVATIACDVPVDIDLEAVRFGTFEPAAVAEAFGALRFTSLLDRVLALRYRADSSDRSRSAIGAVGRGASPTADAQSGPCAARTVRRG